VKFGIRAFFNTPSKFKFHATLTKVTGTLPKDLFSFLITSHLILLRMRNVPEKSCRENQNTFYIQKLFSENYVVYGIM